MATWEDKQTNPWSKCRLNMSESWPLCICFNLISLKAAFESCQCRLLWCLRITAEVCLTCLVQLIDIKARASSLYLIRSASTTISAASLRVKHTERDEVQDNTDVHWSWTNVADLPVTRYTPQLWSEGRRRAGTQFLFSVAHRWIWQRR